MYTVIMYKYYNPHPDGLNTGDCVVRAIMKATGMDWHDVYSQLCVWGYSM